MLISDRLKLSEHRTDQRTRPRDGCYHADLASFEEPCAGLKFDHAREPRRLVRF